MNFQSNETHETINAHEGCFSLPIGDFNETGCNFKPSDLTLLHLNIRGCRTNFDDFSSVLATMNVKFSCIALTETNIHSDIDTNYQIHGYKCENLYSKHGIKLYIKDSLSYSRLEHVTIDNEAVESLFIKINFKYHKDLIVGAIYRPHSSTIRTFNEHLNDSILTKLAANKSIIVLGDININMRNINSLPVEEFCNLMHSYNLHQGINEVTRYNSLNPANSTMHH